MGNLQPGLGSKSEPFMFLVPDEAIALHLPGDEIDEWNRNDRIIGQEVDTRMTRISPY